MVYKVKVSEYAEAGLNRYLDYVTYSLENFQAVLSILKDYDETIKRLSSIAGGLKILDDPTLSSMGYRKIHLKHHHLILIYRIKDNIAYVDGIFHTLQDYENMFKNQVN